ncbi:TPA: hypothetical protein DCW38_01945 [candidate division WOR-3 bacterium]|jgi:multimeric flavodoxin WrbA|uniref:NADPH-dependent FMN reductase-like domain-containing protein n=1 Tax=candidate division WOR-3 bacterium TaxID=2052148 RepID=A0A350H8R1_UNCW3|nr:hypothetical protein [candidate division WOR-3 bacterium]
MKIVMLNGSARKNGSTNALLTMIADHFKQSKFECDLINISDYKINYCLGCQECKETKECKQIDDVKIIYEILKTADLIIVATPSYWGSVTGQLKVFFDRSLPYCDTIDGSSSFPKHKRAISISIRAGAGKAENMEIIKSVEHYFSHLGITPIGNITFENIRINTDLNSVSMREKIYTFTEELISLLHNMNSTPRKD